MNYRYALGWSRTHPVGRAIAALTPWTRTMCRAGDFWNGVKSVIPQGQTGGNFADICRSEITKLWDKHKELVVLWSGGMDSTLLAALLVESRPKDGIIKLCSESQTLSKEHQGLDWLLEKGCVPMPLDANQLRAVTERGGMVVSGYHADTLLSGDLIRYWDLYETIWDMSVEELFLKVSGLPIQAVRKHVEDIQPLLDLCPLEKTAANIAWWLDFVCAWDDDEMALKFIMDLEAPGEGYVNFFAAEPFQLWAIQDANAKIGKTKETHKQVYYELLKEILGFEIPVPINTEPPNDFYVYPISNSKLIAILEDWTVIESGV